MSQQDHNVNALVSAPPKEEKKTGWVKKEKVFNVSGRSAECSMQKRQKTATVTQCMAKCEAVSGSINGLTWWATGTYYYNCFCLRCKTDIATKPRTGTFSAFVSYFKYA